MRWVVALALLLTAGCAKLPAGGAAPAGKRIIFQARFDGEIRDDYIYIFPIRVSDDPNPPGGGPVPVIAPPWGNGFMAGDATHFVRYEPNRPRPFVLYKFNDPSLLSYTEIGILENYQDVPPDNPDVDQPERHVLRFEVELRDLADTQAQADALESARINFLTMDRLGSGPSNGNRGWDALGNGGLPSEVNSWFQFPLRTAAQYRNSTQGFIEPPDAADVADPALDLRDWFIEVRLQ